VADAFVLDTSAILALTGNEPGADALAGVVQQQMLPPK
jgi:PIN domain nuclease of toxin-antitoxin system